MTNEEQLARAYPKEISRIKELASARFLAQSETTGPATTLASAFDWYTTAEGWEFWNELYETGYSR